MKRTLTILTVLTLLTGALFAADPGSYLTGGDKITLNATVAQVPPTFEFWGDLKGDFLNATKGGPDATIITNSDLTVGAPFTNASVIAYFRLKQTITSRYSGELKVTFTATPFSANVGGTECSAKTIHWYINYVNHDYKDNSVLVVDAPASGNATHGDGGSYECILKYGMNAPVPGGTDIIRIAFQWDKEESLPASPNYTATVSVTIAPV